MLHQVQVLWKSIMLKTNITKQSELLQEEQVCVKLHLSPSYVTWMEAPASFLETYKLGISYMLWITTITTSAERDLWHFLVNTQNSSSLMSTFIWDRIELIFFIAAHVVIHL